MKSVIISYCFSRQRTFIFALMILQVYALINGDREPTCQPDDFHYDFTECDSNGGRWRVSVPRPDRCIGGAPNAPVRVKDCTTSCDAGTYFNLSNLECQSCPPGTSSLGGGLNFDTWETMPPGFHAQVEAFRTSFSSIGRERDLHQINCSKLGWQARGEFLASPGGPCAATLTYTVKLVKPGTLSYTYQYTDDSLIFKFQAQNEQCQSIEEAESFKWPPLTEEGQWHTQIVQLRTGINVLQWKTIGVEMHRPKPVLIHLIEISGVAYTSSCTPCRKGSFSKSGARLCSKCPKDTYSRRRAVSCIPCNNETQFAPPGSSQCIKRPPCTPSDFYEMHTPCDANNQTQLMYRWVDPLLCQINDLASILLPPSGQKKPCPPCNPGMQYGQDGCQFCPVDHYSDGSHSCQPCPPSTTPNYGYQLQWFAQMPSIITSTCMSLKGQGDDDCSSKFGWQAAGDHLRTVKGHASSSYLLLSLNVAGFRGRLYHGNRAGGLLLRGLEAVGRLIFSFQLVCQGQCEFVFMQASSAKGVTVIQSWSGSVPRQYFSYSIMDNDAYTFSWAFQKVPWEQNSHFGSVESGGGEEVWPSVDYDVAKIFSINVTNTIDGGASTCLPCPMGFEGEGEGCVSCPPGQYVDPNSTICMPCPPNTVVSSSMPFGKESCKPCGPGMKSTDGQTCVSDCVFNVDGRTYDLRALSSPQLVKGTLLFTASGTQYFHLFNVSLCGIQDAQCANNVSYPADGESSMVRALVCRSTVVPSQGLEGDVIGGPGGSSPLSTQAVSLGDHLLGITQYSKLQGVEVSPEFTQASNTDLHFFYATPAATRACPDGRATTITLRCNPTSVGNGTVHPPTQCPDATCDGCHFHLLWESSLACPQCTEKDYSIVRGECVEGQQEVHYLPVSHCIVTPGSVSSHISVCSTRLPLTIQITIFVCLAAAFLTSALLICFWKRHRHLEYKYMKLVASGGSNVGVMGGNTEVDHDSGTVMAPAESCALAEGEEEEEQDDNPGRTGFRQPGRGHSLLNKIKAMAGNKNEKGNPFETIQLTGKDSMT